MFNVTHDSFELNLWNYPFILLLCLSSFGKTVVGVSKYKLRLKVVIALHCSCHDVLIMNKCNVALYSGKPIETIDHEARNSQIM